MTIKVDLGTLAVCAVMGLFIWVNHVQFMAGYDNFLFEHKTPEEKRLREAAIQLREKQVADL